MSRVHTTGRAVLRAARSAPGSGQAVEVLRGRLSSSPAARAVARRVAGLTGQQVVQVAAVQPYPPPGWHLAGQLLPDLPVLLVDLASVPGDRVTEVVTEVARWQLLTAGFRPVFLAADGAALAAARAHGHLAELALPGAGLAEQVGSMTRHYRAVGLLEVGTDGLSGAQLAFLANLPPAGPAVDR